MIYVAANAPFTFVKVLVLQVAKFREKSLLGGHCNISKTEVCKTEVWPDPMYKSVENPKIDTFSGGGGGKPQFYEQNDFMDIWAFLK